MKIALITTHPGLIENKRIEEEVVALGHEFQLVDLTNFEYEVNDNGLFIPQISDLEADIAVFRGIFLSLKQISDTVKILKRKGIKVFDNSLLDHKYSINKITDTIKLGIDNIPMPKAYYSRKFDSYLEHADRLGYPLIVKLTRAGKGAGVEKFESKEELEVFITQKIQTEKNAAGLLMQEFIPYKHDLRILIIGGRMFAMKRIPREGDFRANFSLGGTVELFEPDVETQDLALRALKAVDMSVGGVDVLITEDNQKYILEVNHTAGMVGMEEATKENITQYYVKHVIEKAS